jgi:hypothetical protein
VEGTGTPRNVKTKDDCDERTVLGDIRKRESTTVNERICLDSVYAWTGGMGCQGPIAQSAMHRHIACNIQWNVL